MLTWLLLLAVSLPSAALERSGSPYPLDICPMTGRPLPENGGIIVVIAGTNDGWLDGRELRVCCETCATDVRAAPAEAAAKADILITNDQGPRYPRTTCVVMTKRELPPIAADRRDVVFKNRLVRLCCERCWRRFHADPAFYLNVLDESAVQQQTDSYPLQTCPVTGAPLGETAEVFLVGDTLIKTCCGGCKAKVLAAPLPALSAVRAARAKAVSPAPSSLRGNTSLLPSKVLAALDTLTPNAEVLKATPDVDRFVITVRTIDGELRTVSISRDGWVLGSTPSKTSP